MMDLSDLMRDYPNEYGHYLSTIWGRMHAEDATSLSDEEIERTLSPCVAANRLILYAKFMRDNGDLQLEVEPKNYKR